MTRLLTLTTVFLLLGRAATAQDAEPFHLRVGAGAVSGTERFTITRTATGYDVAATIAITRGPTEGHFTLRETLGADWSPETYSMEMSGALGDASVKAERKGGSLVFTIKTAAASPAKEVPIAARLVLMDNMVAAPYQVLLNLAASTPGSFTIVVPFQLATVNGVLSPEGTLPGTLDGRPITVRKWTFTLAGIATEIYADAATNRFLRLVVPAQDAELVHEGFVMAAPPPAGPPAERPGGVKEQEIHFTSGDGQVFPATLCLPAATPAPLVVLVQGSGPQDRDETIGPNKPFRDLAWGLAERGVATLRYDKRTFAFPKSYRGTLDSESIDDAVAAVHFAAGLPEVAGRGVFVFGHSLGGLAAPYVAQRAEVRGLVLASAPGRTMDLIIRDQVASLSAGRTPDQLAETLALQDAIMAKVRAGTATAEDVQGQPPAAIRDMIIRDPIAELRKTTVPILVIKGGKDAQVFQADFDALSVLVTQRPGSEARLFPNLTHILTPVEGTADFRAILQPGRVAPEVLDLVASWVRGTTGGR